MSRQSRRRGASVMVRGPVVEADCAEWLRSRRGLHPRFTDTAGRAWEAFWPRTVGTPDMPRWRISTSELLNSDDMTPDQLAVALRRELGQLQSELSWKSKMAGR